MKLVNKNIILISPEKWGINKISKHHYALALATAGNRVFFINPPSPKLSSVKIAKTEFENLTLVDYSISVRGINRISIFPRLLSLLSSIDARLLKRALSIQPDIVWSFDPYRFQNIKIFKAPISIFQPVDYYTDKMDLIAAKNCDIIFSVSQNILDRYSIINTPKFLINHGLSKDYIYSRINTEKSDQIIRCGYIGNLLSFAIHWENLLKIVAENTHVEFHFIGPYVENNLGITKGLDNYIKKLKSNKNAFFFGSLPQEEIATRIQAYDLFLICYNPELFGNVVSNSHKILEYLSTGKVVVSSRTSYYDKLSPELFEMVINSEELPKKFKDVVDNLSIHNSEEKQSKRREFAQLNSYSRHLKKIERLITEFIEHK